MDASSSAYQLMSFMLFNGELAVKTNLIKRDDSRVKFYLYSSLIKDVHNTVDKKYEKAVQ